MDWADGFMVVYNISDRASFITAKNLLRQIREARLEHCKGSAPWGGGCAATFTFVSFRQDGERHAEVGQLWQIFSSLRIISLWRWTVHLVLCAADTKRVSKKKVSDMSRRTKDAGTQNNHVQL